MADTAAAPTALAKVGLGAARQFADDIAAAAIRNADVVCAAARSYAAELNRAQVVFNAAADGTPPLANFTAEMRMVPELGVWLDRVWVPYNLLADLANQDPHACPEPNYDAGPDQIRVLTSHGLAVVAGRPGDGLLRGDTLAGYMARLILPGQEENGRG